MKREDVFRALKIVGEIIPRDSFVLVYGGALCVHGIKKDTSDIDITVESKEVWEKLKETNITVSNLNTGAEKITLGDKIDLHFGGLAMGDAYDVDIIRGFRIMTVKSVRAEKLARGREKDINDVKKIDEWIVTDWLMQHR